jgi:hypothetical protein
MAAKVIFRSAGGHLLFQNEMIPRQYPGVRRPKEGGKYLEIFQDLKAGKNLRSPPPASHGLMPDTQQAAHFI